MLTAIGPPVGTGAANADTGTSRTAIASDRNREYARTAMRKELTDILYPGTCTSRQKRYAAVPAPHMANVTPIDNATATGAPLYLILGRATPREPGIKHDHRFGCPGSRLRAALCADLW